LDSLYLLLPLSVLLVLALIALFGWALHAGQFEDLEREGWRVLEESDSLAAVAPPPPVSSNIESSNNLDDAQTERRRPYRE
jgi:cbb3-type cytochrome oxidase maturation protein